MFAGLNNDPRDARRAANVLIVSGIDAAGLRGLTIDLAGCAAMAVIGHAAVTCSALGSHSDASTVSPDYLSAMIRAVFRDKPDHCIDSAKVGWVLEPYLIDAAADALADVAGDTPTVVDPVLYTAEGVQLAGTEATAAYLRRLLAQATVVTANRFEAQALSGRPVGDRASAKDALRALYDRGVSLPLVKLHLDRHSVDLVYDGDGFVEFGTDTLPRRAAGSGSLHSTLIAALLGRGLSPLEAIDQTRALMSAAIEDAVQLGKGRRVVHPGTLEAPGDFRPHEMLEPQ